MQKTKKIGAKQPTPQSPLDRSKWRELRLVAFGSKYAGLTLYADSRARELTSMFQRFGFVKANSAPSNTMFVFRHEPVVTGCGSAHIKFELLISCGAERVVEKGEIVTMEDIPNTVPQLTRVIARGSKEGSIGWVFVCDKCPRMETVIGRVHADAPYAFIYRGDIAPPKEEAPVSIPPPVSLPNAIPTAGIVVAPSIKVDGNRILNYMELSDYAKVLNSSGKPGKEIAKMMKVSDFTLHYLIALQSLHPDLKPFVDSRSEKNRIGLDCGAQLAKIPLEQQKEAWETANKAPKRKAKVDTLKKLAGSAPKSRSKKPEVAPALPSVPPAPEVEAAEKVVDLPLPASPQVSVAKKSPGDILEELQRLTDELEGVTSEQWTELMRDHGVAAGSPPEVVTLNSIDSSILSIKGRIMKAQVDARKEAKLKVA